ncbi:MAG TPA: plasmid replication protein, CyRepA1 family, partial [Candidatus Caenarcaniphilales bacterium]
MSQRYLGTLPVLPQGLIGIRSAKGTGKTESLKPLVWQARKVLLVGHRVALLRNQSKRLGLPLYSDEGVNIERVSKLAITVDSLPKLPTLANQYDLVLIDEVEQVLDHLVNSTTCKSFRERALLAFEYFCKTAKKVVVLDADLSDVSLDYLCACRSGETPYLIVNGYLNGDRQIRWFEGADASALVSTLKDDIAAGGRPYVFTDSKTEAKRLEVVLSDTFPNKHIEVIHGDNSGEEDKINFVEQINQRVREVDVLIATPSLGTGVSIDVDHFSAVYGIAHGGSLSASQLSQGLFRVRPRLPMAVWVSPKICGGYRETSSTRLREDAIKRYKATGIILQIDPISGEEQAANQPYLKLWSELNARKHFSLNRLRESLADLLKAEGHILVT